MTERQVQTPVLAYVGLGANLGDAQSAVRNAIGSLNGLPGTRLIGKSALYRSAPWQAQGPEFINAVASVATTLPAPALLQALQALEADAGRERPYRNAPRTLDLDLLLYGQACMQTPTLVLPHPRMWERAFVLVPLAELAPAAVSAEQLARVAHQEVRRIEG